MAPSGIRRRGVVVAAAGVFVLSGLLAPAALAAPQPAPAPKAVTNDSPPPPPADVDPNVPGIQVMIPYYTEPEFLLQAGAQRWDVRNRPAGTVAAGYGHTNDAIHDDLTATARYAPLGAATSYYGVVGANRQPLDVTTVIPGELRAYTWLVTRYDDGTVEFQGPMEKGMPNRYVFGANLDSPNGYVGGTVLGDAPGALSVVLVRAAGTLAKAQLNGNVFNLTTVADAGGAAVAAVSRSVSAFAGAPRRGAADEAPNTSTLLVVWRADGQFVPFRIGVGTNGITKLNPLSSLNAFLNATPAYTPSTFDFDFDCVADRSNTPLLIPAFTGTVATYLSCPAGHEGGASVDTISLGRISVGVPVKPVSGPEVRVLTAGDYAKETGSATGTYLPTLEITGGTGCAYASQPTDGSGVVPVGSFDIRTVLGVTHLACVEPSGDNVKISEYMQPRNAAAWQLDSDPLGRAAEKSQATRTVKRTSFDHTYEPDPDGSGNGDVPLQHIVYHTISQPTIQIQFPCAHLLARPVRTGMLLDDCDTSSGFPFGPPPDVQIAPPPPNWISYTVAAYATTPVNNHQQSRLIVTTTPGSVPLDRTYYNNTTPSPFGTYNVPDNFSWTTEPSPYLASDLTAILADLTANDPDPDVDVSTLDVYHVPAQNRPRLLLAQVVRPARTTVELDLGSSGPTFETSPSVPIAVLEALPLAGGMGQNENYTATFGQSTTNQQSSVRGGSTTVGAHAGIEATMVVGEGAGGNHIRAGGGVSAEFEFSNEVEASLERSVSVEQSDKYGATFNDHTIVTRTVDEYVWHGTILKDPTGLASGLPATYNVPVGQSDVPFTLSNLAQHQPGLYGPNGLYGKSLERILGGITIGDPGSYLQYLPGEGKEPANVLAANGGPCKGGYTDGSDFPTPFTGDLPKVISPENPFYDKDPPDPTGPNIIVSSPKLAKIGDLFTSSESDLVLSAETTRSLLTSLSYNFSVSAIGKFQTTVDAGVSAEIEVAVTAGVDAGWGTSAGVSDTLGSSTELVAVIGDIPYGDPGDADWLLQNDWANKEVYNWKQFMCKAQLGPIGLGHEVWVQGYLTANYNGIGGIDDLKPVALTAPGGPTDPGDIPLVRAAATPGPANAHASACTGGPNEFHWSQEEGTLKQDSLRFEDTLTGAKRTRDVESWANPTDFIDHVQRNADDDRPGVVPRPSCAGVDPGAFVDGRYYIATVVADGFLPGESVSSNGTSVHAEVWPPQQTLTMPAPVIAQDGSAKIQIQDPDGVTSLKHHVKIVSVRSPGVVVEEKNNVGDTYQTLPLAPGTYEATVYGFNDHVQSGNQARTDIATIQFTYAPAQLAAQWSYDCGYTSCTVDDTFQLTDESTVPPNATIVKWAWTFGDGSTSTLANPSHRFTAPSTGTGYPVKLKVTDSLGHTDTLTQNLVVAGSRLPNLTVADVKVNEKDAPADARFKLRLSKPSDQSVNVTFSTADGTAIAGKDYKAVTGSVTFAPGETVKTVKVRYLPDSKSEPTEAFKLRLQASATLVNVVDALGVCKIVDDD